MIENFINELVSVAVMIDGVPYVPAVDLVESAFPLFFCGVLWVAVIFQFFELMGKCLTLLIQWVIRRKKSGEEITVHE